jgi:leader peptidase (prepilin peptidase)/N-methyltransferase
MAMTQAIHYLQVPSWVGPLCFSPAAGSFVGVLIRRLPAQRSSGWCRSQCDACSATVRPAHLVPIVSYVVLGGRCGTCRSPISPFYVAIELLGISIAVWACLIDQQSFVLWTTCLLGWLLLALAWIDAEHMRLPDKLTLPLLVLGVIVQAVAAPDRLPECLIGAAVGYAGFRLIAYTYRALRKRDGLGMGDAKLVGAAGAWVGLNALPDLVFLAVLLALLAICLQRVSCRAITAHAAIPFGPFLAASTWLTYLYGPMLLLPSY